MQSAIKSALLAMVGAALVAAPAHAQARKELRLAHHMPLTNHMHKSAEEFAKYFNDRSKAYEIKIFGGGQLFTEKAIVEALVSGGLDMGFTTASWWGTYSPSIHVLNSPMLLTTYPKAHAALAGKTGKALAEDIEKAGVKVIGWVHSGIDAALVNTVRPIAKLEDFKGMRIRTSFPMVAAVLTKLGAGSVVMSSSEVYTALQRRTFDGTLTGAPSVTDRKWVEVTKFGTYMPTYFSAHPVSVTNDIYKAMPETEQKLLIEAAQKIGDISAKRAEVAEQTSWAIIRKAYEVVEMAPESQKRIEQIASVEARAYLKKVAGDRGVAIYDMALEDIAGVR